MVLREYWSAKGGRSRLGPKLDKRCKSLMEQAMEKKKKPGKGKKRKADTVTHAPSKKQVATDGTKRVSKRQRRKK